MWITGMEQFIVPNTTHAMLMEDPKARRRGDRRVPEAPPIRVGRDDPTRGRSCRSCACAGPGASAVPRKPLTGGIAPAGADVPAVWHLGRVTGDLERIIAFYHDLLGLGLRGARNQAAAVRQQQDQQRVRQCSGECRISRGLPADTGNVGCDRAAESDLSRSLRVPEHRPAQIIPALFNPGVSSLRLLVRDLDKVIEAAKAAGVAIVTAGGAPVAVPAPAGLTGSARAIMIRDPDGYPVELMQVTPAPASVASARATCSARRCRSSFPISLRH